MIDYASKLINLWTDAQVKWFYEISSISLCLVFFIKFAQIRISNIGPFKRGAFDSSMSLNLIRTDFYKAFT